MLTSHNDNFCKAGWTVALTKSYCCLDHRDTSISKVLQIQNKKPFCGPISQLETSVAQAFASQRPAPLWAWILLHFQRPNIPNRSKRWGLSLKGLLSSTFPCNQLHPTTTTTQFPIQHFLRWGNDQQSHQFLSPQVFSAFHYISSWEIGYSSKTFLPKSQVWKSRP